jgi:tyrosine-protein kinase Etk/Wzc
MLSQKERVEAPRLNARQPSNRPKLLALRAPSDMAMEALRSLRTSLHFARMETRNNLLMIAGPSPGVGKSFVCSNLAVTIAQAGQRVLLIDADMRRGSLHRLLGVRAEDGLSELISGQIPLEDAIRRVAGTENLSFISRGRIPPNPSELLMHANFGSLLHQLGSRYDLVIIDTPPVLAVTDAAVIGQHAGTSLLVVRYGQNQSREIAMAKQRLEQNGVELKGAIVNGVQKGSARSAGHYVYSYEEPLRAA